MLNQLRTVPNMLSLLRLGLVPAMWLLAIRGQMPAVGGLLIVCGLTDFLDGTLARHFNQTTALGAQLDSIADQALALSAIGWVILFKPQMFLDHPFLTAVALLMYLSSLAIGLIKFRRLANLHLYSAKLAAPILASLLVHAFLTGQYSAVLFYLAWATFTLASLETLLMQLARDQVDEHQGSFFLPSLRPKPKTVSSSSRSNGTGHISPAAATSDGGRGRLTRPDARIGGGRPTAPTDPSHDRPQSVPASNTVN